MSLEPERQLVLSMTFEKVSVLAAMQLSAEVAGRDLFLLRVGKDGDLTRTSFVSNTRVSLYDIVGLYGIRRDESKAQPADPLELLQKLLLEGGSQMKDARFLVQVNPSPKSL